MCEETLDRKDTDQTKADYLLLKTLGEELCDLVEASQQSPQEIQHEGFPYYHYMVGIFLLNQINYLDDMIKLIPNRSAELVARTMVEGLMKLKWVEQDQGPRASKWFSFAWLQEYKYAIRQESRGIDVTEDKKEAIKQIIQNGKQHLNKAGLTAIGSESELDPFKHFEHDWTGIGAFKLAQLTKLVNLYARFYDPLNDLVHWSPKGFIKSADVSDQDTKYGFRSYYQSCGCLVAGISSLLGCWKIWFSSSELQLSGEALDFEKRFNLWSPL